MRALRSKPIVRVFLWVLLGAGALWVTNAVAANQERAKLPVAGLKQACPTGISDASTAKYDGSGPHPGHDAIFAGIGTFKEENVQDTDHIMVEFGEPFLNQANQKVVPFKILSIGGRAFAEGVGETRFWLDSSRPVISEIWEKTPGTEFPAIQEMRFHFFYTLEAMPGKVFRSMNPSVMRSSNVGAFPPPPGTLYTLVNTVNLEDVNEPGVAVGKLLSNRVVIPGRIPPEGIKPHLKPHEQ